MTRPKTDLSKTHNDPETPHSLMELEFERGNTPRKTRPRNCEELLNDGPISVVVLRYLLSNWIRLESYGQIREPRLPITGTAVALAEPRIELVERQQDRERDEANALIASKTDRGVGYKYRPKKGGKRSQNINFETSDQFTQSGLTESRKVEWAKWKQFNAVYPVSGPELEQLLDQGHKPIPRQWVDIDKTSINDAKVVPMLLRCSEVD